MNPQNPYQQPQQTPPQQPGIGNLPPIQQSYAQQPSQDQYIPQPQQAYSQQQPYPQPATNYPSQASDQQREEYSIDYLNKIAPKEQRTVNRFAVFGLIGAVVASAIFAVILLSSSHGPDVSKLIPKLDARIQTLKTATAAQQTHLNENDISEANASLSSALGSMDTELQSLMKERKLKKITDQASVANEKAYLAALTKALDDAYQRGTLDRTYTAQMTYELSMLRSQVVKLKSTSSNETIQTFCANSLNSIDITLKSYAAFDAAKS